MKRRIAFILVLCLFITGAKLFRLKLKQQKADYEAALRMKNTAEMITLLQHD